MRKRQPNRWLIAVVSCLSNLCLGVNYAWSVVAGPLAERLSEVNHFTGAAALSASDLAIVFALTNAIMPIPMILGGAVNDRRGPREIVFVGGALFGIGLLLTGQFTSVGGLIFAYSILVGLGNGLVFTCTVNNTVKFFPDRKGLIGGLTTASYGLGSIVFAPIAQALIDKSGVSNTLKVFGIIVLVVICVGALFLAKAPETPKVTTPANNAAVKTGAELNWHQMLGRPIFYIMLLLLACGALQGQLIISHASAVAQEMVGLTATTAALVVSLVSGSNAFGRLLCGYASDKLGRVNVIAIAITLSLIGLILLYFSSQVGVAALVIGVCLVGLCFGCFMGVYPGFTADRFGIRNNSLNYGVMMLGNSIGAIAGPGIMSSMHSSTGSFRSAFLIAASLALAGIVLTFIYRAMARKESR